MRWVSTERLALWQRSVRQLPLHPRPLDRLLPRLELRIRQHRQLPRRRQGRLGFTPIQLVEPLRAFGQQRQLVSHHLGEAAFNVEGLLAFRGVDAEDSDAHFEKEGGALGEDSDFAVPGGEDDGGRFANDECRIRRGESGLALAEAIIRLRGPAGYGNLNEPSSSI